MKIKTLLLTIIVLLAVGTSFCFAEGNDKEKAARELLITYDDMRYATEAGITKVDYIRQYRELYTATQKAKETIDVDIYEKFDTTLKAYEDALIIWDSYGQVFKIKDINKRTNYPYPYISQSKHSDIFGQYQKEDVISYIFSEANIKEKDIKWFIDDKYKNSKEGE
ncbi:MAG TPA: hypothetical protein PKA10_13990 [Selenomonadales bacterium]|nr:hypothetical protein [Selenomonadales bacterium]